MNKLSLDYQSRFKGKLLYDNEFLKSGAIDPDVQVHDEAERHPLSSAGSCINVLGSLTFKPIELTNFLNSFGLNINQVIKFPTGANIGGRVYQDKGYVIFEWVGPLSSPINEVGGKRGSRRTSIDAYVLAEIEGKLTQLLIEWKFTEGLSRPLELERFSGLRGLERLRRYSSVLAKLRNKDGFPFMFKEDSGLGMYDFSVDHLYQLLRMTLLAKTTTPIQIGDHYVEDYRIVHLTHSQNTEIEILQDKYLTHSPGLKDYSGKKMHDVWKDILSDYDRKRFVAGNWDISLPALNNDKLRDYLVERYYP